MAVIVLSAAEKERIDWGFTAEGKRVMSEGYEKMRNEMGFPKFVPVHKMKDTDCFKDGSKEAKAMK